MPLNELLPIYRKEVQSYLRQNKKFLSFTIELTPKFLRQAEERIVKGNKTYGDDYKHKNNLIEIEYEKLDIFNYLILEACKKAYRKKS